MGVWGALGSKATGRSRGLDWVGFLRINHLVCTCSLHASSCFRSSEGLRRHVGHVPALCLSCIATSGDPSKRLEPSLGTVHEALREHI